MTDSTPDEALDADIITARTAASGGGHYAETAIDAAATTLVDPAPPPARSPPLLSPSPKDSYWVTPPNAAYVRKTSAG